MSWLKWHIGTVTDPKFRVVSQRSHVTIRDVLAVWAAILECAASAEQRGSIDGMDREAVAVALEMEVEQFEAIHAAMQGRLLEGNMLKNFTKRQAVADPTAADRKRRQREREQKTEGVTDASRVTERDVTPRHEDKKREEEIREENLYTGDFENCWAEYPKRSGSNDKRAAFRAYGARLKEGHKPADMLAGVKRYAAWCRHTGKVGTETVKQASTFFGPSDPPDFTLDWRAPGQPAPIQTEVMELHPSLKPWLPKLRKQFDVTTINAWFVGCELVEKDDWFTIVVPKPLHEKFFAQNFSTQLRLVFGEYLQVKYRAPALV